MSDKERKYMSVKEFRESGLLFEVNRCVLHPLGLAISIKIEDDGTEKFAEIWDVRDSDPEGIVFDSETFLDGEKKINQYMENKGNTNLKIRQAKIGFIVQATVFEEE